MKEGRWNRRINRGTFIRELFSDERLRQFLRFALLGLLIVSLHTKIAVAIQPATTNSPAQLLEQAEDRYQVGQLSDAIALWQEATTRYEDSGDRLNQALVLNFLAAAFTDLRQWKQANQAIEQAIGLLNTHSSNPGSSQVLAQVLTTQGKLQLSQGKVSEALAIWQQAETVYRNTNDEIGILGSQINQARALQSEGLYRRATALLTQVEQSLQNQPDSRFKVTGLRNLGKMLRLVGNLRQSRIVLEQSLAIAERLPDKTTPSDISGVLLSLGNTTRAQGDTDTALAFYQRAAEIAPSLTAKTQVQIAWLSLLVESDRPADAQSLLPQIQSQLAQFPLGHLAVYARINLAQIATKMSRQGTEKALPANLLKTSAQELAIAIQHVHTLGDARAESYALGTLGSLYETTHQWGSAKTLTQQALRLAQSINAPDIAYQWQWQLGRVFCQGKLSCTSTENLQNATAAYAEAVKTLQSLRSDLAAINPEVQFSFRESVEPVYRQFVELLLQSDNAPNQENLRQAREVIEALQLAELDNFFREACITARPVKIDQIDPQAAVIYPIILPNQFAVILSLPNQPLHYHKTLLPQTEIERILIQMRQSLRPTAFVEDWLPVAQQVYKLLLQPVETELAANGVKTLVFVPDGLLRGVPMAALHDGQQYLIEKYSVVLTPGLQLLQPQPLQRQRLQGLLAGLTQAREGFAALPNVAVEIDQVKSEIPAQVLLDQSFTNLSFETKIDTTPSPIIHLATHGQFSSNAENTFILTWDGRINVKQLDQLLRSREGRLNPIELLVLSACQTATGDKRAALGMAGVAVRSGARSTVASLWSVSDRSTASLMIEFYRELGKPGVTKAEALRRAQINLLHQDDYTSPYYWAPFILLGNWL
ncbi:CHAT domain-containing protein [Phormidium sp. CLA17]|uniref:CHAT domain-containing protein n=1 Tax=Leptolyngbya sp. Cla-17 TaxID=2803751 RepID=UPI0014919636|nr:CHAT domain-containing protein [Leptolyngbya sp. Cla-17]MBM0744407.1 CHAT domain-containing protein [Leptolyngbya sp. Cla-17]